jgi:hypothetical protein
VEVKFLELLTSAVVESECEYSVFLSGYVLIYLICLSFGVCVNIFNDFCVTFLDRLLISQYLALICLGSTAERRPMDTRSRGRKYKILTAMLVRNRSINNANSWESDDGND